MKLNEFKLFCQCACWLLLCGTIFLLGMAFINGAYNLDDKLKIHYAIMENERQQINNNLKYDLYKERMRMDEKFNKIDDKFNTIMPSAFKGVSKKKSEYLVNLSGGNIKEKPSYKINLKLYTGGGGGIYKKEEDKKASGSAGVIMNNIEQTITTPMGIKTQDGY